MGDCAGLSMHPSLFHLMPLSQNEKVKQKGIKRMLRVFQDGLVALIPQGPNEREGEARGQGREQGSRAVVGVSANRHAAGIWDSVEPV